MKQRTCVAYLPLMVFVLTCSLCPLPKASAQVYPYGRDGFPAGTTGTVVVGDFNNDGYPDLAVSDQFNSQIDILLGLPTGGFSSAGSYPTGSNPTNMVVADFNSDKKLDIAVVNYNSGTVSILLGNGDGTFQTRTDYPVGNTAVGLVAADFNGDGNLDLATLSTVDSAVALLYGDGKGNFEVGGLIQVSSSPAMLAEGDVNGDGKPDLITMNDAFQNPLFVSLVNQGGGKFSQVQSPAPDFASTFAIGDFNDDGKLDVVSIGSFGVNLSLGNGDGSFQAPSVISNAPQIFFNQQVLTADFNRDHKLDLLFPGAWTMLGNGDGTFQNPILSPLSATPAVVTDINGDGAIDLVAFASSQGGSTGNVSVLLGNGKGIS